MKIIRLTRGFETLVDDGDYEFLLQWRWYPCISNTAYVSAVTVVREHGIQRSMLMHRLLTNADEGQEVDHRDLNPLNNQRYNLRVCTTSQNHANARLGYVNTSGFKGARRVQAPRLKSVRWQAGIKVNGKSFYLGSFDTAEEAARVYDAAAVAHFGEFALTNKVLGLYA